MNTKISDQLKAAKALINVPGQWTQTFSARAKNGMPCAPTAKEAVCWCSIGALAKVTGTVTPFHSVEFIEARDYLGKAIEEHSFAAFNDNHNHEEVMRAWDAAILLAEVEEAAQIGGAVI